MRVIKHGNLPEDKLYTTACNHCKCEFEFARREAQVNYDRTGDFLRIACPDCKWECTKAI